MIIVDPQIAGHGIVDTQTKRQYRFIISTCQLCPIIFAICLLIAAIQRKALLIGHPVDCFIGDYCNIKASIEGNNIPNSSAIQTICIINGRKIIKVILVADHTPLAHRLCRVIGGHDQAAGRPIAIVVVAGVAHDQFAIKYRQTMYAVGYFFGRCRFICIMVGNTGRISLWINFDQRHRGVTHTYKI